MSQKVCEKEEKSCQRQQKKNLNQNIWLWSCGKNLTKREIKDYAMKTYQDAGVTTFKASDGWYRRWMSNWKNVKNYKKDDKTDNILYSKRLIQKEPELQNSCDLKGETKLVNSTFHSDVVCLNRDIKDKKDCKKYNPSEKSEFNNTQQNEELPNIPKEQYIQDCSKTGRLPGFVKEKYISFKTKGEKYFPHFKAKVISYALEHSIKSAASTFKVNKDTVSDWIHQSKQLSFEENSSKLLACFFQDEKGPDYKFIQWLKSSEKHVLSRQLLIDKANELITSFGKQEPNKKNLWFFLYAKRLNDDKSGDKIKIKYPQLFKQEVVNCTDRFSKKMISKIFNIDRKRICEWVSDVKSENVKKRNVSKYLTDPTVDSKIWEWYCLQKNKPTSKEVRAKAALLYEEAGFPRMMCSPGWYYRWRMRHHLPPVRMSQASRDSELLAWVLNQIDENKSIVHSDLLKQASLFKGADFKASPSWVFRFTRKYMSQLHSGSIDIALPDKLSEEAIHFKNKISSTICKYNLNPCNIVAFDELPLNFGCTELIKNDNIIGKNGWDNCQASVILSCLASGKLLPTCLILKEQLDGIIPECKEIHPVLVQSDGINDRETIGIWLKNILRLINPPSVIICDAYDPHKHIKSILGDELGEKNIEFLIIPGGCSSHLHPISFGIGEQFKMEVNNHYQRWCHESSVPDTLKLRFLSSNEVYAWVQKAHRAISSSEDLIKQAFVKAGIVEKL